jgi:hypothetical protein
MWAHITAEKNPANVLRAVSKDIREARDRKTAVHRKGQTGRAEVGRVDRNVDAVSSSRFLFLRRKR